MAAPQSDPSAASRRRRRLFIVLGVLALLVGVRAALPEVLRRLIESNASEALGRKVALENVDLGLVTGRAKVEGLAIGGADLVAPVDPERAVVRLGSAGVQIAWLPLLQGKIHLREIALAQPTLRLERNPDGTLAPLVLAEPALEPEPEPEPEAESEAGGIDVAIDRVSLDGAELHLVRSADAESIAELRFENLSVADLSMQQGVFGIGAVALRGPALEVQSDRLATEPSTPQVASAPPSNAPAPAEPQAARAPASPPPKHRVKDFHIEGARFAWLLSTGEAVEVEIEVHATDLGLGDAPFPLKILLTTDDAKFALEGRLAPDPIHFDGSFSWEAARLDRLIRLAPESPLEIPSGLSDGKLDIALRLGPESAESPPGVRVEGDLRVYDLDLATKDDTLAVRWKDLAIALDEVKVPLGETPAAPEVHLAKIALQEPQLDFTLRQAAGEPELAEAEPPAPTRAQDAKPAPQPQVLVDALEVTGGKLHFRDTTVKPPVDTALRDLRIRAQGVRWPERDIAKLLLTAKGQQASSLKIAGGVKGGAGDVDVELKQLPLGTFDPYAANASGLSVQQGRLSLTSKLSLGKDRFGAKSVVSLHQLSVSEREAGWFQQAFGMPLDVALALLRDLQGDITLPVDVEQDEKGTQVGVAAAVTAALRQALVGALAAPLKMLGAVAGTAGKALSTGLEPIPMPPGQGALGAQEHQRVDALAKLLASRPGLQVVLVGRADPSDDPLLARRVVLARAQAGEELPGEGDLGFFERRRVRSALADADPDAPDSLDDESAAALDRLASQVQVTDEARQALALSRAQAVAQALQQDHGASADAVAGIETGVGAPGVEIELRAASE
jgi:hypothetical protein